MAVPRPSGTLMEADRAFILHITPDILNEVRLGAMGRVAFYFKDSNRYFAMTVTEYAIPLEMQPVENRKFKLFIKDFAKRVNGS